MNIKSFVRFLALCLVTTFLIVITNQYKLAALDHFSSHTHKNQSNQLLVNNQVEDIDYMISLGLMKGHLIVGKELIELSEFQQAEPHFGHPVEEIYGNLQPQLEQKKVPEFKSTLTQLHEIVKFSPQNSQFNTQYNLAINAIDKAISALPETQIKSPDFVLEVINGLLVTTNEEYTAAIIDNKIVENVEYQDSRGFVLYSHILYQNIFDKLANQNPQLNQNLKNILSEIKSAFPSAIPPQNIVKTPKQMSELVSQFNNYIRS